MKLLTIGIDGGDRRIIEAMPMPFLQGLIAKNSAPEIKGDLYSRGWAEIYTGKHCLETGAFYMHPKLDGSRGFTQSYNYKTSADRGVPMLWDLLNKAGMKVGFMNIPTTSPAPEVEGFFVGGGGGGVSKTDGVPINLCDSENTQQELEKLDYIPDLRLGGDKIERLSELFDRLDEILKIRRDAFLKLSKIHQPEFGFLCFRVTTTVQYLAMSEIEAMIASQELADIEGHVNPPKLNPAQERIQRHFSLLDKYLSEVFEELEPEEWLLCADHGASQYKYDINVDTFLKDAGFQYKSSDRRAGVQRLLRRARGKIRKMLPSVATKLLRKSALSDIGRFLEFPSVSYDPKRSKAFGNWYVQGIYINDKRRFGGIVSEGEELSLLVDEICRVFNSNEESIKHQLKAVSYRRHHLDTQWSDKLPDIIIEKPDEMFFGKQKDFITRNTNYGPIPQNISGFNDMHSGQKSTKPLFAISSGLSSLIHQDDERDIQLVFKVIARFFNVPTD
jgi:predicted AlkP superfamily phosphohydrolase/phosphomutase